MWADWVNQVPIFSFNSGKYDLSLVKEYFVKTLADMSNVNVTKKDKTYMFLSTPRFKFLDVRNYLAPDLSENDWCRGNGCGTEKLVFPYKWVGSLWQANSHQTSSVQSRLLQVEDPGDPEVVQELCNQVMKGESFGFLQVNIHVPNNSKESFSEFCPLFIVDTIPKEIMSSHMEAYQERTGQKTIPELESY